MSKSRMGIEHFLCDTWWYGLTKRLDDDNFKYLAKLRSDQGFTAVQLVVGVPPEVGPENPNSESLVGPAWNLKGEFNDGYLDLARKRIKTLNSFGLTAVVYGAWGQQIEWLGVERIKDWWREIVNKLDDLRVIYCLTGESDVWIGEEKCLLPDKTTEELNTVRILPFLHPKLVYLARELLQLAGKPFSGFLRANRRSKWSAVLAFVDSLTSRPIIIHTLPRRTSDQVVNNSNLLDAITVQTGHDANTRNILWQLPLESRKNYPNRPFINLEPWYEGITGKFDKNDQLYAYWVSMMAGAHAYCYGAHGVWNVGDGKFLAHWGNQTIREAIKFDTPKLIGKSHKLIQRINLNTYNHVEVESKSGKLVKISRINKNGNKIMYIPDVSLVKKLPRGKIFLPLCGRYTKSIPKDGQVVVEYS